MDCTSTSPGPGSWIGDSTSAKFSAAGYPSGREASVHCLFTPSAIDLLPRNHPCADSESAAVWNMSPPSFSRKGTYGSCV